jgi:hypothetical protein
MWGDDLRGGPVDETCEVLSQAHEKQVPDQLDMVHQWECAFKVNEA